MSTYGQTELPLEEPSQEGRTFSPVITVDGRKIDLPEEMSKSWPSWTEAEEALDSVMQALVETGSDVQLYKGVGTGWHGIQKQVQGAVVWHAYVMETTDMEKT